MVIVVGTSLPVGEWKMGAAPGLRMLLITRDAPCEFLDRLRDLSGEGRARVLPCFSNATLRDCSALPGPSLDDLIATATVGDTAAIAERQLAIKDSAMMMASASAPPRTIAFYLPQFHPIAENDLWWGAGFTEWTNARRGKPQFIGHYQPHEPGELGYYDLREASVRAAQADLARSHGVYGFCYYFYWFNGKRLLERPLNDMLTDGTPDFPFCVCWANENWTRRWDGLDREVLMEQVYGSADAAALMLELLALFRDARYIRVNGRPLLLIYKPHLIPDLASLAAIWRRVAAEAGEPNIYLCACETSAAVDPRSYGFDAAVEFPPHRHQALWLNARTPGLTPDFGGVVTSYRSHVIQSLDRCAPTYPLFRSVMPMWDNTARRQITGTIFTGSSPELFEYWVEEIVAETCRRFGGDERLIFVNAWNEWGEGCHLEPDQRYGRQYLEALRDGLAHPQPTASVLSS
jgi:lipopolysaccharide biosynthesis protein